MFPYLKYGDLVLINHEQMPIKLEPKEDRNKISSVSSGQDGNLNYSEIDEDIDQNAVGSTQRNKK
jgi:hypothetical protein